MTTRVLGERRARLPGDRGSRVLLGVAGIVAVIVLVTGSHPAGPAGLTFLLYPVLGAAAVGCWVVVGVHALLHRRRPRALLVTPLVGALTVGLVWSGAATRVRFAVLDRLAFEAVVAQAPEPVVVLPDRDLTEDESYAAYGDFPGWCPPVIGTLRIRVCSTFAAGYLFFDDAGSGLIDDGGVAYLPAGIPEHDVGNGSFESPQFEHLVGPWYAFASSW